MKIEQIYTGCLSHAAYCIESNGEAARFHADFVSGHLDLAKRPGGKIVFEPIAKPQYGAIVAKT